jgi:hypothetical protein
MTNAIKVLLQMISLSLQLYRVYLYFFYFFLHYCCFLKLINSGKITKLHSYNLVNFPLTV